MMIEGLPGSPKPADSAEIEKFLDEFNQHCVEFGYYCDQYMREELGIGDITRHLSEATADAEMFFGENSFSMTMEQLQRYGMIQKTLDNMTVQLFETEIKRNRKIVLEAIKNGEYFIVGLTFNSIKSSIYMMYSKQKIKTEQEQKLAELEQDQEATQSMIKVLKAIESTVKVNQFAQLDYQKIQKALEIYVNYFRNAHHVAAKSACDERVFRLFNEHVEFLRSQGFGGDMATAAVHFSICCDTLRPLAQSPSQLQYLASWHSLITF
ncbi:MAG: hypothetical protein ACO1RX_11005 [Candidatus Sericytochromatia bacterium]